MKKIILFFALFLSFFSLSAQTKTGEAIYVYRNDGFFNSFLRSDVDSITFSSLEINGVQRSDMVTQQVWMADSVFRLDLSVIDSMKLSKYETPGEAIDLGLSVKWANCNVGASSPEGYGGYYAWGETEKKIDYTKSSYQYYNSKGWYLNIGSSICGTQYDVARVKWGGSWRMPTREEYKELYDKCTWKWTTYNGVKGQLGTGPNGNSIFLPAAGVIDGTYISPYLSLQGTFGDYRSGILASTYDSFDGSGAYGFSFNDIQWWFYGNQRSLGCSVRPVTPTTETYYYGTTDVSDVTKGSSTTTSPFTVDAKTVDTKVFWIAIPSTKVLVIDNADWEGDYLYKIPGFENSNRLTKTTETINNIVYTKYTFTYPTSIDENLKITIN